jgi:membrane dipeptidase
MSSSIDERIKRLHANGIVDLHFDLPMDLFEKRKEQDVLARKFLPDLEAGNMAVVGAAIYIDERYLPELALRVGADQVARLYAEAEKSGRAVICASYEEILRARANGKIAFLITMEGVEPLGRDLDLLRVFYQLGVRVVGLTHARRNAAGDGGVFAPSGSPRDGLTKFGRDVVRACETLGIIVDLAHISPKGFEDIIEITAQPVIVSHTNARKYHDIERNISDEQIKMIGKRGGVIGVNAVLVSAEKEKATLDHYVDHIEYIRDLIGIDGVAIGFDFFEFLYQQWPDSVKQELAAKFTKPHFIPDLTNHSHAANLTRKLVERGFSDEEIEKILRGNWMRILKKLL